jgi:hypothetical protein
VHYWTVTVAVVVRWNEPACATMLIWYVPGWLAELDV